MASHGKSPQLEHLPAEILQYISEAGPCQSVLNLIKTSRKLRTTLDNMHIFRAIIRAADPDGDQHCGNLILSWGTRESLSLQDWKRYALANDKAHQLKLPNWLLRENGLIWAPQMMALHRTYRRFCAIWPLNQIEESSPTLDSIATKPFHIDLIPWEENQRKQDQDCLYFHEEVAAIGFCYTILSLASFTLGSAKEPFSCHLQDQMHSESQISLAFATSFVGFFAKQLKMAHARNTIHRPPVGERQPFVLPLPTEIPFKDFMALPPPFSQDCCRRFATCHLPAMLSPSFLCEGAWMGYYSNMSRRGLILDFDYEMSNIRFAVVEENSEALTVTTSDAKDGIAAFTLTGTINKTTGYTTLVKQYHGGADHRWSWDLLMTPFGFLGRWGPGTTTGIRYPGAWVWLWKEDWIPQRRSPGVRSESLSL
ncbi:MAG: hypothetical protein Q9227_007109 [Pyrenula ochraceoflavens]